MWTGATIGYYGQIKVSNRNTLAHRVSLLLAGIHVPQDMDVLHTCDNTLCVNPKHLFLGDHLANMEDKAKKGRAPAKLNSEQVKDIKKQLSSGRSCNSIAIEIGVVPHTISDIKNGITWRHVS